MIVRTYMLKIYMLNIYIYIYIYCTLVWNFNNVR